jgi:hypothetical protein
MTTRIRVVCMIQAIVMIAWASTTVSAMAAETVTFMNEQQRLYL